MNVNASSKVRLEEVLERFVEILRERLADNLYAVALFGSVVRGVAKSTSDIDILVVYNSNTKDYRRLWTEARREWEKRYLHLLRQHNLPNFLSPIFLNEEELKDNPLILLDIIDEGLILFDKDDLLRARLEFMKNRLKEVGARKIYLREDRWYWDLKPDWRPGERFSL